MSNLRDKGAAISPNAVTHDLKQTGPDEAELTLTLREGVHTRTVRLWLTSSELSDLSTSLGFLAQDMHRELYNENSLKERWMADFDRAIADLKAAP